MASDSLDYVRFAAALRERLPDAGVRDIISKLPPNSKVYGFDVGDFSSDGVPDVALSVREDGSARRELSVLMLTSEGEGYELAVSMRRLYQSEPIEIGFAIEDGVCRVTTKREDYDWNMTGYAVVDGSFREVDTWNTRRAARGGPLAQYGLDILDDHRTLRSVETWFRLGDGRSIRRDEYLTIPAMPAGIHIPPDQRRIAGDTTHHGIVRGASSWFGSDDCALGVSAVYDSTVLILTVGIRDERLLTADGRVADVHPPAGPTMAVPDSGRADGRMHDDSTAVGDRLLLCVDPGSAPRITPSGKVRAGNDGTFIIGIEWNEDTRIRPRVRRWWNGRSGGTLPSLDSIRIEEQRIPGQATLTVSIPRSILGRGPSIGFAAAYHDRDNPEQQTWLSVAATAPSFTIDDATSWGRLDFVRANDPRLLREDLRLRRVIAAMRERGLLR